MKIANLMSWNFLKGIGSFFLKFVYGVIAARWLGPEIIGQMAMILSFAGFAKIFINSGFKSRIIQAKEINNNELNTIFTFNIILGIILAIIFYLSSDYIANFFNTSEISFYIKIYSFTFILQAMYLVPIALNDRNYKFKKNTQSILISNTISLVVAVIFIFMEYGLFSLILYSILNNLILVALINYKNKWNPKIFFCRKSLYKHLPYSINLLFIRIFEEFVSKLDNIITGKYFNASSLGFFSKSKDLARLPNSLMTTTINNTVFTIFSRNQDNNDYSEKIYKKILYVVSMIYFNIFFFLIYFSKELINIVLSEKWIDMDIYFKLSLFAMMIKGVSSFKGYFILSKGDSKLIANSIYAAGSLKIILIILLFVLNIELNPSFFLIALILSEIFLFIRYEITVCKISEIKFLKNIIKYLKEFLFLFIMYSILYFFNIYFNLNLSNKILIYFFTIILVFSLQYGYSQKFRLLIKDVLKQLNDRKS